MWALDFLGFFRLAVVNCWDCWVGSSWVLPFVFCWATYVYFLVYLEGHCAFFFYIYIITYIKKKHLAESTTMALVVSYNTKGNPSLGY